jgi:uncharacterized protein YndB with AHSA1/START domain
MTDRGKAATVVVRRTIPATVDELFDAWLDPECLAQWMRPGMAPLSTARVDARVNGSFEVVMHSPGGPLRHYGVYRDIVPNKKIVLTWCSDATYDTETLVTVQFNVASAGTEVVVTHERMPDQEAANAHSQGWTQALELLEKLLAH